MTTNKTKNLKGFVMKKTLFALTLILMVTTLFSCKLFTKEESPDKENSGETAQNEIFSKDAIPTIVYNKDKTDNSLFTLSLEK